MYIYYTYKEKEKKTFTGLTDIYNIFIYMNTYEYIVYNYISVQYIYIRIYMCACVYIKDTHTHIKKRKRKEDFFRSNRGNHQIGLVSPL